MSAELIEIQAPRGLYLRGNGIWYIQQFVNGQYVRVSTGERDLRRAIAFQARWLEKHEAEIHEGRLRRVQLATTRKIAEDWQTMPESVVDSLAERMFARAKKGAKRRGLAFTISLDEVRYLIAASDGHCALTGMPFDHNADGFKPFVPSIDRIDSNAGYVAGNCRIVCLAVNIAMSNWGEEVLEKLAIGFLLKRHMGRRP